MDELLRHWRFAGEAALAAELGAALLLLAICALLMDRRRGKRRRVGPLSWMPWTGIFLASAMAGFTLLAMGLPAVLRDGWN